MKLKASCEKAKYIASRFWDGQSKTFYLKKSTYDLSDLDICNSGPYSNITGMRNLYWGKDALIVKQGAYIYYFGIIQEDDDENNS